MRRPGDASGEQRLGSERLGPGQLAGKKALTCAHQSRRKFVCLSRGRSNSASMPRRTHLPVTRSRRTLRLIGLRVFFSRAAFVHFNLPPRVSLVWVCGSCLPWLSRQNTRALRLRGSIPPYVVAFRLSAPRLAGERGASPGVRGALGGQRPPPARRPQPRDRERLPTDIWPLHCQGTRPLNTPEQS